MMAANTKDAYGRCRKLPNHLQNPHLLRYTLLTVKYTYVIYTVRLKIGKTLRLPENKNKRDHLLL